MFSLIISDFSIQGLAASATILTVYYVLGLWSPHFSRLSMLCMVVGFVGLSQVNLGLLAVAKNLESLAIIWGRAQLDISIVMWS